MDLFFLRLQVYNLAVDDHTQKPSASFETRVTDVATGRPVFELAQTSGQLGNVGKQLTLQQRLAPEKLPPGRYRVTIEVHDLLAERSITPEAEFEVR